MNSGTTFEKLENEVACNETATASYETWLSHCDATIVYGEELFWTGASMMWREQPLYWVVVFPSGHIR